MRLLRLLLSLPLVCAATLAAATALIEHHGVQTANMDCTIRPGDDFNLYANGGWKKQAVLPPDQPSWGSFSTLRDKAAKRTADLLEAIARKKTPPGSDEAKIADYFASSIDEAGIEAKGLAPSKPALERVANIGTRADL